VIHHDEFTSHDPGFSQGWVAGLKRFARAAARESQCELCGTTIPQRHRHFIEPDAQRLVCSCDDCRRVETFRIPPRLRAVPERVTKLSDFAVTDAQWDAMLIPVGIAFFYKRSSDGRIATYYPGPAGAMESTLAPELWRSLESEYPQIAGLEPDVEALLVNRVDQARAHYCVPIDRCYALIGLMRAHWRGFTGGPGMRTAVAEFFADLESLARAAEPAT
jgi:hypothetical protein